MINPLEIIKKNPYTAATLGAVPVLYGANALISGGDERWDRTAENTAGNLVGGFGGATAGYRVAGIPGAVVGGIAGALGGGYASDVIANQFDDTDGKALTLIDAHLGQIQDPYQQEAELRAQLQQVKLAQRQQQQAQQQAAMQQYQ